MCSVSSTTLRQQHRVAHLASLPACGVATACDHGRCVRPTSATQLVKDEHPYLRCLLVPSKFPRFAPMSCAVHAVAARFGSSLCDLPGACCSHIGDRCESPLAFRHRSPVTKLVDTRSNDLECLHRCLVKDGGFHIPKRLLPTTELRGARDENAEQKPGFLRPSAFSLKAFWTFN